MVFVGLMGGASYVNVAYLILSSKKIPDNMKELCMNINNICNNIGVTSASITAIIVSNLKWVKIYIYVENPTKSVIHLYV